MPMKSTEAKLVRISAGDLPRPTEADLDRLRAGMAGPIDTSDIPEQTSFQRLKRDANGRLPPRPSRIHAAVVCQVLERKLSEFRLWKMARNFSPELSRSVVRDFLAGTNPIELKFLEAILAAVDLHVVERKPEASSKKRRGSRKAFSA